MEECDAFSVIVFPEDRKTNYMVILADTVKMFNAESWDLIIETWDAT